MAAVKQEYDYNFDMFDVPARARTAASAAPARKARPQAPLKVVQNKKTVAQQKKESRSAATNSLMILIFAAVIMALLCLQINAGAKSYEISRKISAVESEIQAAKSENVRLNAELNSITSIGNIDDYATHVLGMSKIESYQVEYIDLSQDDGVIFYSGGGILSIFSNP